MLVLSRREAESIIIQVGDEEIEVCVLKIKASSVRLGIVAPKDVVIVREEIKDVPAKLSDRGTSQSSRTRRNRWNMPPVQKGMETDGNQDKSD